MICCVVAVFFTLNKEKVLLTVGRFRALVLEAGTRSIAFHSRTCLARVVKNQGCSASVYGGLNRQEFLFPFSSGTLQLSGKEGDCKISRQNCSLHGGAG